MITPDPAPGHPEILRLVAPNPGPMTLEGTNTYVVGSDPAYVIDPGPADPEHLAAIGALAAERGGIGGLLVTHSHADHSEGASRIDAPVLESGPFEAVPTPGHTPDHTCFVLGRVVFAGDLVLGRGSAFVPPDGGSLAAYLDSLRAIADLEPELLCPGHGPYVTDPLGTISEYLEHRADRERRLVAALESGERSRGRLQDAVWDDVPPELRGAARLVMAAHLDKLAAEGRLPGELSD